MRQDPFRTARTVELQHRLAKSLPRPIAPAYRFLAAALFAAVNGLHGLVGELDVRSENNGSGVEPVIAGLDVCNVARAGSGTWSTQHGPWRLTHADLKAIDQSWSGDPDDLSPSVAAAIAITLDAPKPWREPVDDIDQPLRWADGIDTTRPSASRVSDPLLGGGHPGEPVPGATGVACLSTPEERTDTSLGASQDRPDA